MVHRMNHAEVHHRMPRFSNHAMGAPSSHHRHLNQTPVNYSFNLPTSHYPLIRPSSSPLHSSPSAHHLLPSAQQAPTNQVARSLFPRSQPIAATLAHVDPRQRPASPVIDVVNDNQETDEDRREKKRCSNLLVKSWLKHRDAVKHIHNEAPSPSELNMISDIDEHAPFADFSILPPLKPIVEGIDVSSERFKQTLDRQFMHLNKQSIHVEVERGVFKAENDKHVMSQLYKAIGHTRHSIKMVTAPVIIEAVRHSLLSDTDRLALLNTTIKNHLYKSLIKKCSDRVKMNERLQEMNLRMMGDCRFLITLLREKNRLHEKYK